MSRHYDSSYRRCLEYSRTEQSTEAIDYVFRSGANIIAGYTNMRDGHRWRDGTPRVNAVLANVSTGYRNRRPPVLRHAISDTFL